MLIAQRHGKAKSPGLRNLSRSAAESLTTSPGFEYFFPECPDIDHGPDTVARLDALGQAMVADVAPVETQNSNLPPIFTYFGQFLDHDVTAGTDRGLGGADVEDDALAPLARDEVVARMANARTGFMDLDSIYGGAAQPDSIQEKLIGLMRHPQLAGKMRVARPEDVGPPGRPLRVPLPEDGASDLFRLGAALGTELTEPELRAIPDPELRMAFFHPDASGGPGALNPHKALIGDGRNDENLFVAQLHLAILRFHNRVVDACDDATVVAQGDQGLFIWARDRVRWIYQWLSVNEYLARICDAEILALVLDGGAPLYGRLASGASGRLPMPIEFSTAAFRFGHSMIRAQYDWNRFFGRAEGDVSPFNPRADLAQMFGFTGNVRRPMFGVTDAALPSNWPAEWNRLALLDPESPDRSARKIDTLLAPPLADLPDETGGGLTDRLAHLAQRNLRRGHLLNLPSAQHCLAAIAEQTDHVLPALTVADIGAGASGAAAADLGFAEQTPLWFYILKEAETAGQGERLGPLGTYLVASTIAGLVIYDPQSYWHLSPGEGRWTPEQTIKPAGEAVTDFPALLRAALLL